MPARASEQEFPIEAIARYPLPGMAVPTALAFRPDDRLLSCLYSAEGSLTNQVYAFDLQSGALKPCLAAPGEGETEENLSLEEKLRRERQRQRALGITQYAWAPGKNRLLVPIRGALYAQDAEGRPLRLLVAADSGPVLDAQFSPDDEWVAYVQDAEIYAVPYQGGTPRQLTHGARGSGRTHGLAEYVAQEEMSRNSGFWWSGDSRFIAFEEVDETHIPVYRIVHQGKDQTGDGAQEDHHYPFAGKENAKVRLGVVPLEGGEPAWMQIDNSGWEYLARVGWLPDGRLVAQFVDRLQNHLDLVAFDPASGIGKLILSEHSDVWINLHDIFHPVRLQPGGERDHFLWASERSGYRHLYLYRMDGTLVRQLTRGAWLVDSLAGVDEELGLVYFLAGIDTPLESHLYRVPLSGGEPRRLTHAAGMHAVLLDHACARFVDTCSSLAQPPRISLCALDDGHLLLDLFQAEDARISELGLEPPELVTLANRDGDRLYGAIYRPTARFGPGPHPTIVQVYGGPHAQTVTNTWSMTVAMRAQYLRSLGYLVWMLDNRGSLRRGLAFEGAIRHAMGSVEVQDQVDGVRWLVEQGLTDPCRVGIYGWSYGGYMTLMCLLQAPDVFRAGVAGAPVASWDGYDTFYTERYMGTPETNPEGYANWNVMRFVENLRGKLMIVHGLIDENVHFRHTARLINALIRARKPYELLLFPDERHMPRKLEDRVYMEERMRDFLVKNLSD